MQSKQRIDVSPFFFAFMHVTKPIIFHQVVQNQLKLFKNLTSKYFRDCQIIFLVRFWIQAKNKCIFILLAYLTKQVIFHWVVQNQSELFTKFDFKYFCGWQILLIIEVRIWGLLTLPLIEPLLTHSSIVSYFFMNMVENICCFFLSYLKKKSKTIMSFSTINHFKNIISK